MKDNNNNRKITDDELKMLHLLYDLINNNKDRKEVDLSIEIFWRWKDYLYEKYDILPIEKQYIDHDGTIKIDKKNDNDKLNYKRDLNKIKCQRK